MGGAKLNVGRIDPPRVSPIGCCETVGGAYRGPHRVRLRESRAERKRAPRRTDSIQPGSMWPTALQVEPAAAPRLDSAEPLSLRSGGLLDPSLRLRLLLSAPRPAAEAHHRPGRGAPPKLADPEGVTSAASAMDAVAVAPSLTEEDMTEVKKDVSGSR